MAGVAPPRGRRSAQFQPREDLNNGNGSGDDGFDGGLQYGSLDGLGGAMTASGTIIPPTLSQETLKFLDGIDEVPKEITKKHWATVSRHNQLTNIDDKIELHRHRLLNRAANRMATWDGELDYRDVIQLQKFSETQLSKSYKQKERRLLAPQVQEMARADEFTQRAPQPTGVLGRIGSMIGFGGNGRR